MNSEFFCREAAWIWIEDGTAENCYASFFQHFQVTDTSVSNLHVSVEGQYVIYINGQYIPSSQYADYPKAKAVQRIDITNYLQHGTNELEIQVWYAGRDTQVSCKQDPGLCFTIFKEQTILCYSSSDTKTKLLSGYVCGPSYDLTPQLGAAFSYLSEEKEGWRSAIVVAKSVSLTWKPIEELVEGKCLSGKIISQGVFQNCGGDNPGVRLQQSGLFFRDKEKMTDASDQNFSEERGIRYFSQEKDGLYLILDIGENRAGFLTLDMTCQNSTLVEVGFGEHLDDLRVRTSIGGRAFAVQYQAGRERKPFIHRFRRISCRYLQLFIYGPELTIFDVGIIPVDYPVRDDLYFHCENYLHNRIYEAAINTMKNCMHEHYEDSPWREQALYAFDGRNEMLTGYYAFGNFDYARENLRLLSYSQREDGLLEICAPAKAAVNIPCFSLVFVIALHEYCLYSGDLEFGHEMLPVVRGIMQKIHGQFQNGLVWSLSEPEYWNFYEWQPMLNGEPIHRDFMWPKSADAVLHLYYLIAIQRTKELLEWLDLSSTELEREYVEVQEGIEGFYNPETGLYASFLREGNQIQYAELVQSLILYSGICPEERREHLCETLISGELVPITLGSSLFKYEALISQDEKYGDWIFEDIGKIWGSMLSAGSTTFWETIDGADAFDGAGSLCHGWSAFPVYLYGAYILGIRPEKPGIWNQYPPVKSAITGSKGHLVSPNQEWDVG